MAAIVEGLAEAGEALLEDVVFHLFLAHFLEFLLVDFLLLLFKVVLHLGGLRVDAGNRSS